MALYRLMLEDHAECFPASLGEVQKAVWKMAIPEGPTFLTLIGENGSWVQAGGTDGRYRVEARHVYGEGFKHFMAALPECPNRARTVVYYRNECTENEHPHRKCPLPATVANVLSLDDVLAVLTEYWATGELSAKFVWDDQTAEWSAKDPGDAASPIEQIRPKRGKGG